MDVEQQIETCGYLPIEERGKGASGLVYQVKNFKGEIFAFKYITPIFSPEKYGLDSLIEIDISSRLSHPNIIHSIATITEYDCDINGIAVILPLADRSLYDYSKDPLQTTEMKLPIFYKLAKALEFMHQNGILYLDIKEDNVVLQGNEPYFIDFGLSLEVGNTAEGTYNRSKRGTILHRPPEILNGGRIYNAAVDIWSFGIMILDVLIGKYFAVVKDFKLLTDDDVYPLVTDLFSTPDYIIKLLNGVRNEYKDELIDLLVNMLQIDPSKRLTATQIVNHPIFNNFREDIHGILIDPPISFDYSADHRNVIKLIITWERSFFGEYDVESLFLSIDLYNRVANFYKDKTPDDRMNVAAACIWISNKIILDHYTSLDNYVSMLIGIAPSIEGKDILQKEIEIVHFLSGILNVSNLYKICRSVSELKFTFDEIIIVNDSTLYARVDVPEWSIVLNKWFTSSNIKKSSITEFFE